ncbi:sigma-70 family RNA polymerase sigma factor [Kitasatospora azatica]|uniref:sigma-70 family RNA polymerase sigma factor n=1 Tax=Kitasatospora azatica TaxID=58347 RepID=UPI000690DE96|nr:sigma-70 family RNA polymerase sigma factor [Kitasatospora azatica]
MYLPTQNDAAAPAHPETTASHHSDSSSLPRGESTLPPPCPHTLNSVRRTGADTDAGRCAYCATFDDPTVELVRRAQEGDSEAFALLYSTYSNLVYRYIYQRVGNWAVAQDLTSDTFMRMLSKIGIFRWKGRRFDAWLVTIARNLVIDYFKSSRVRLEVSTSNVPDGSDFERSAEEQVLESLSQAALMTVVCELTAQQRECIILRLVHECTVAETAMIMDKSHGAVKSLLCRAVRNLTALERTRRQREELEGLAPRRPPQGRSHSGLHGYPNGVGRAPEPRHHMEVAAS